jgi:hypothetical protein
LGGSGKSVMLAGTARSREPCHPRRLEGASASGAPLFHLGRWRSHQALHLSGSGYGNRHVILNKNQ